MGAGEGGAGYPAGGAYLGDEVALADRLAFLDQNFVQVHVDGRQAVAVIQDQGAARIRQELVGMSQVRAGQRASGG